MTAPRGARGGEAGVPGRNRVNGQEVPAKATLDLEAGVGQPAVLALVVGEGAGVDLLLLETALDADPHRGPVGPPEQDLGVAPVGPPDQEDHVRTVGPQGDHVGGRHRPGSHVHDLPAGGQPDPGAGLRGHGALEAHHGQP